MGIHIHQRGKWSIMLFLIHQQLYRGCCPVSNVLLNQVEQGQQKISQPYPPSIVLLYCLLHFQGIVFSENLPEHWKFSKMSRTAHHTKCYTFQDQDMSLLSQIRCCFLKVYSVIVVAHAGVEQDCRTSQCRIQGRNECISAKQEDVHENIIAHLLHSTLIRAVLVRFVICAMP